MNVRIQHIISITGVWAFAVTAMAKSDLASPEQRHDAVNRAMALAEPQPPVPLPADLKNPLAPHQGDKQEIVSKKAGHASGDREVLAAIATRIVPSGVMQLNDQPVLLLREKKLKVGDYLTITFEGADYMVELAAISHSSFTLRLNKEEITQPLNP